jgi:hypothetical protein
MKTESAPAQLSELDRDALTRAIEMARKLAPDLVEHWLATGTWFVAAVKCASLCQRKALGLREPWRFWAPADVEPNDADAPGLEHRGISDSARLLRRMLAVGVSKFEPDSVNALARVERAA